MPVGVPPPAPLTVAVKVTDCPETDGFVDDATVVVDADWPTICVRVFEALIVKLPSPL
jgi:hypothetical protein